MLSLLADENLDGNIVRGILRRVKGLNLARVQDLGMSGLDDPTVLRWAAEQGRILVTSRRTDRDALCLRTRRSRFADAGHHRSDLIGPDWTARGRVGSSRRMLRRR